MATITGTLGNDLLLGTVDGDTMSGIAGDDSYYVDHPGDLAIEQPGQGHDRIYTIISYALSAEAEIEVLALNNVQSAEALNLTGNGFGQLIYGNAGANILIGGGGVDVLIGAAGNDIYLIDGAGDAVFEAAGQGIDQVFTDGSHNLRADAEVEVLAVNVASTANYVELFGNAYGQLIYGNAGSNMLIGGGGADILVGLAGNDLYLVDGQDDVVFEAAGGGHDGVYTTASHNLRADAEIEVLAVNDQSSTNAVDLFGNAFSQSIFGNAGNNMIIGGGGNDLLAGFGGDDTYLADSISDQIIENAGGGFDRIYVIGSYALAADAVVELLAANDQGSTGPTSLTGNAYAQGIYGDAGNNVLRGEGGNDFLMGMSGEDQIFGGDGDDWIVGGAGIDTIYSGPGNDLIFYESASDANEDNINDWENGDRIDLSAIDANVSLPGNQAFEFAGYTFGTPSIARSAGSLTIGGFGGTLWIEGHVDGDGVPDLLIWLWSDAGEAGLVVESLVL